MTPEQELEDAVLEVCARAASENQISLVSLRRGTLGGAVSFARELLERHGATSPGYRHLVQADRFDLTLESLILQARFRSLFSEAERLEARARLIDSITARLNQAVHGHVIGTLQTLRTAWHGLETVASLFDGRTIKRLEGHAYHVGGSEELQFRVALVGFGREPWFRYGVAFAMRPTRVDSDLTPFRPRIARFNEYLTAHPDDFTDLKLQHHYHGEVTSYDPGPIPPHFVRSHALIFLGTHVPFDELAIERVVVAFDQLMPLYHYVETGSELPQPEFSDDGWALGAKTPARYRAATETTNSTVDRELRHRALRGALFEHLKRIHGRDRVHAGSAADAAVTVTRSEAPRHYRVSTALTARGCLHQTLGRLLDDVFWSSLDSGTLVVVGEPATDAAAEAYLQRLHAHTGLVVQYRQFDLQRGCLV